MPAQNTSTCIIISLEMLLLRANYLWVISLGMRIQPIFSRRVLIATSMQLLLVCSAWFNACVELNLQFSLFILFISFHFLIIYLFLLPSAFRILFITSRITRFSFFLCYYSCMSQGRVRLCKIGLSAAVTPFPYGLLFIL